MPLYPDRFAEHQFRQRRTVTANAILMHDPNQKRIRTRLHRKKLLKPLVPRKSLLHRPGILPDSLFIIQIKRGGISPGDLLHLLFCHKRYFTHLYLYSFLLSLFPDVFFAALNCFVCVLCEYTPAFTSTTLFIMAR